jgi:hypothetical protein
VSDTNKSSAVTGRNVVKQFGSGDHLVTALDGVSLEIEDNEFFTLLGPSGCGKTTLLRLIAGFEMPTRGEIFLFGDEIEDLPPHKRSINTVFQHYALFPHMTVGENVAFGLRMLGQSETEIAKRVEESLSLAKMESFIKRRLANQYDQWPENYDCRDVVEQQGQHGHQGAHQCHHQEQSAACNIRDFVGQVLKTTGWNHDADDGHHAAEQEHHIPVDRLDRQFGVVKAEILAGQDHQSGAAHGKLGTVESVYRLGEDTDKGQCQDYPRDEHCVVPA